MFIELAIINQQTFTIQWSAEIQCRRLMPDHNHALTVWQNFTACLCCHPRPSKIWVTLRSSWSTFSSKWVHEKSHNKRQDCKHWILFRFGLWHSRYHSKNWSSGHVAMAGCIDLRRDPKNGHLRLASLDRIAADLSSCQGWEVQCMQFIYIYMQCMQSNITNYQGSSKMKLGKPKKVSRKALYLGRWQQLWCPFVTHIRHRVVRVFPLEQHARKKQPRNHVAHVLLVAMLETCQNMINWLNLSRHIILLTH